MPPPTAVTASSPPVSTNTSTTLAPSSEVEPFLSLSSPRRSTSPRSPSSHSPPLSPSLSPTTTPPQASTTTFQIYILCIVNFGISFIWALEFALTTPFFQQALRATHVTSHLVWVLGPISGLVVAPLVGYYSDRCTSSYGRRRPFIASGAIFALIGIAIFCNSPAISKSLGFGMAIAIPVAVVGFGVMDFAVNTVMWPVRSLQGDLVEKDLQHEVQSASVVMGSAGDLVANALVARYDAPVEAVGHVFAIGMIVFVVCIGVILVVAQERPWYAEVDTNDEGEREMEEEDGYDRPELVEDGQGNVAMQMNGYNPSTSSSTGNVEEARDETILWLGLPRWFWKLGFVYFLCFASLFAIAPNISSWMGETVMGGDSDAPEKSAKGVLYEKGVALYSKAGLLRGIIQILFSAFYPALLRGFRGWVGGLLGVSYLVAGIVILVLSTTTNPLLGYLVVAFLAVSMAALFTLPVAVVVGKSQENTRGKFLGVLNVFAVLPQLMDTIYTGVVSTWFGEHWVMRIGALWAIAAGVSAFVML